MILVFGASGHIGGPCGEKILRDAPATILRLVSHRLEAAADQIREQFPEAEVMITGCFDLPALIDAFEGVDGCFVVTPDVPDEERAMLMGVAAARSHGTLRPLVRLVADPIGMTLERVPDSLEVPSAEGRNAAPPRRGRAGQRATGSRTSTTRRTSWTPC